MDIDRLADMLGINCCKEHEQHMFVAPKNTDGVPIFPVPGDTRCRCGEKTLAEVQADEEREQRDEAALADHATKWGSRHRVN